ncbi:hypothetical protein BCR24_15070 [Enterococcus ureilyticus]|uniref:Streptopain n=1 Tax=Enterococcus ureilyticus TaxID=1131292 RepID=A0A1E5HC62_9ENTE|nr:C10 family peptidase [Enterococcus ureilyticus]MBM7690435.1 streptopain [Enterococcus ureilyticus]OEG22528.1 hypothetical protein BCR24_15070 [Enterococcus ureilyticus]
MKKILKLLAVASILFSSFSVVAYADEDYSRSSSEAEDVALSFFSDTTGNRTKRSIDQASLNPVSLGGIVEPGNVYAFNKSNGGFIVISGDKRSPEVLAYSKEGSLDVDLNKTNILGFLEEYSSQVEYEKQEGAIVFPENDKIVEPEIPALLDVNGIQYGQGYPYNFQTPVIERALAGNESQIGNHAATGCVATATVQIMKYHNYPERGIRDHSYLLETDNFYLQNLTAPISTRHYDWNNILPTYNGNETSDQVNAVAQIMSDVGIASNMYYGASSGSFGQWAARALVRNFGYSDSTSHVSRDNYSADNWKNLINNELVNLRPIYYEGVGRVGGHAFVLDGADGNGFYHINWGWDGNSNGYFRLDALNPRVLGIGGGAGGFNTHQGAIIGIKP